MEIGCWSLIYKTLLYIWEFGVVRCTSSFSEMGPGWISYHLMPSRPWKVSSNSAHSVAHGCKQLPYMTMVKAKLFLWLCLEILMTVISVDISLDDICGNKLVGSCPNKISLKVIGGESSCAEKVPWNVLIELTSGPSSSGNAWPAEFNTCLHCFYIYT